MNIVVVTTGIGELIGCRVTKSNHAFLSFYHFSLAVTSAKFETRDIDERIEIFKETSK